MTVTPAHSRTPAVIGFLVAGAALLGVSFLASLRNSTGDDVPALEILAPTSGDTVENPVVLEFRTAVAFGHDPALGWSAGELHLHALIGDREIMPAAADITPGDATFAWRLPPLPPGTHHIRLTWAGRQHGNLSRGSDTTVVHVRR